MQFTKSLNENRRFRALYHKGKSRSGKALSVYIMSVRQKDTTRLGITVSTKLGKAVVRNKIRRRIKEAYRISEKLLKPGYDIVIVARHGAVDAPFALLLREMTSHFSAFGIIRDAGDRG